MKKPLILISSVLMLCLISHAENKTKRKIVKKAPEKIRADWQVNIVPAKDSKDSSVGVVEIFPHSNDLDPANFAIVTDSGKRVPSQLLWNSPGEPMKFLFDSSGKEKSYSVLFGNKIPPMKTDWEPKAGLIMETRKRAPGNANNWKEAQKVIDQSTTIEGRSPVGKIFHGINPHGPSRDLVVYYKGFLKVDNPGEYRLAIAADDAVFLLIDGKKITDWPGWHGPWEGTKGKFAGKIHLNKGIHKLEFYNIQNDYGLNMVCGWQPPGKKYLEVIPQEAFVPLKRFTPEKLLFKDKEVPTWFEWTRKEHLMVNDKSVIYMNFKAVNPPKASQCKWYFDDNGNSSGQQTSHLFFSPGMRKVRLEVKNKSGKLIDKVENQVKVAPRWQQQEEWPKDVQKHFKKYLRQNDLSKLPAYDLSNLVDILEIIETRELLAAVGKICLARKAEFADNPWLFFKLSQCYIHYSIREYGLAEQAYQAALAFAGKDDKLTAQSKLYYGALKIHNYGKCEEGIKLLNEINEKHLADFEKRKRQIWLADAYMTMGNMDIVDKIYAKLPDVVDKKQKRNTVLNEARVLNALDFLSRGEYDDAEKMVWQVEWEFPYEAMKSQTGLVMTKIFIKRKEYNYALWRCMRMMNAAQNSRQMSDIMLTLIEIYHLTGNKKEAAALSQKLLKEYPYSEAAAILKEKL